MGIFSSENPDVTTGPLTEFGFQKIERATKAAYVNMLQNFFSVRSTTFDISMPELASFQNKPNSTLLHIRRDFPFGERVFPLVVPAIKETREKKSYVGSDDMLTVEVGETPDGLKVGTDVFAGMAEIDVSLMIASTSPDERSRIAESIFFCFTHYFRTQFIYAAIDGSLFSITPATKPLSMGSESEITDSSNTSLVFVKAINISTFIEYQFKDYANEKSYEIVNVNYQLNDQLNVIEF